MTHAVRTGAETPVSVAVPDIESLRRSLDAGGAPTMLTEVRRLKFLSTPALAQEIRRARRSAHQGDIFTPDVAERFRRTIQAALRNEEMEHIRRAAAEQRAVELTINEGYPPGAEGATLPGCLGRIFPPLPEGLEYQFVGRSLVLWDARAAIVVDYLPGAIPELTDAFPVFPARSAHVPDTDVLTASGPEYTLAGSHESSPDVESVPL